MDNASKIIIARKIQVLIDSEDKDFVAETFQTLRTWQHICFRAANYIFTHHYVQDQLKDLVYIRDEMKVKLADHTKDEKGILTTSRQNTTYQVLASHFKGEVPMHVLGSLNNTLVAQFNKERMAYARGERSLRNYKRDIPVPFKAEDIKNLRRREDNRNFTFSLFGIPFKTYLGRDFTDKPLLLEEVCEGRIRLCSGAMRPEKGKLFWFAYFEKQKETKNLDENVFAEASLSIETPIVLKIGKFTYLIGNKEEFLYRRLAIQAARQRLQFSIKHNGGGHGRKRKMQPLEVFNTREKNYTEHKMHLYSKKLIDICLKHHVATIILTFQQDKETVAKEDPFILRNWSYYSLKEKIKYKAQRVGMAVITE